MNYLEQDDKLLCLERELWAEGFSFIAGVDEVGRGPLAGPVVAAAVIWPRDAPIVRVNDSKQLTETVREELDAAIRETPGIRIGLAEVGPERIDRINILQATHEAMRLALAQLPETEYILVDGRPVPHLPAPNRAIVKGDAKSASIAAASIIAKVYRDRLMVKLDIEYPGYGLAENKGYGTERHMLALKTLGATPIHRRSFAPVREVVAPPPEQPELF